MLFLLKEMITLKQEKSTSLLSYTNLLEKFIMNFDRYRFKASDELTKYLGKGFEIKYSHIKSFKS